MNMSWGDLICVGLGFLVFVIFVSVVFSSLKGCSESLNKVVEESKKETTENQIIQEDDNWRGKKVRVTIQIENSFQTFEGVFVARYGPIIVIKTNDGKIGFGGTFVIKEIK
jgi:hypothetical protein